MCPPAGNAIAFVQPALRGTLSESVLVELGCRVTAELTDVLDDTEATAVVLALAPDSDGLRETADVYAVRRDVPIIVLAAVNQQQFLEFVMAGASAFCDPSHGASAVERTLAAVAVDGVAIPRQLVRPLVEMVRDSSGHVVSGVNGPVHLTVREWEVLALLRQQRRTDEIADELFVSQATVRSHVAALVRKLGAADREHLLTILEQH